MKGILLICGILRREFKVVTRHSGFMKHLKNISWLSIEKLFRVIFGITIGVWVARYLGPKNFGMLSFACSIVGILTVISSLGLQQIVFKEILRNKSQKNVAMGTAFLLRMIGTGFVLLGLHVLFPFMRVDDPTVGLLIYILSFSLLCKDFFIIGIHFQSKVLSKYAVLSGLLSLIICSLIRVFLILNQYPLVYFAIIILLDTVLQAVFFIIFYTKDNQSVLKWKADLTMGKKFLSHCWPFLFSGIISTIHMKIDQIILQEMIGAMAVGYYAVAERISGSAIYIPITISSSFLPTIINARMRNQREYTIKIQKLFDFMIISCLIIGLPIIVFSKEIITLLYGQEFITSAKILSIYVICIFFIAVESVHRKWLISENLERYIFFVHLIGIIANICFDIILIQFYGVIGAAYGTLLAYIFSFFFSALVFKPIRPPFFMIIKGVFNVLTFKFLRRKYFNFKN